MAQQVVSQATKFRDLLKALWNENDCRKGIIATSIERPINSIFYGIYIMEVNTNYGPGGLTMQQTRWDGGDMFMLLICGTQQQIKQQISQLIKIAEVFNTSGGNADYDQLYPQSENITWDRPEEHPPWHFYRRARLSILASINNKNIFT